MNALPTPIRYQAVSMQLAAYLDGRYVEMQLLTDAGEAVAIACDKNSILAIGRHIRQLGRECPEISTWQTAEGGESLGDPDQSSYEPALSEGWRTTMQEA
jgi:hypothetical protein